MSESQRQHLVQLCQENARWHRDRYYETGDPAAPWAVEGILEDRTAAGWAGG